MADEKHNAEEPKHGGGGHGGGGGSHGGGGGHGHGGGGHEEAHEGAPEWLISFADNTALMMGFFVILLALNMGPKGSSAASSSGSPSSAELDWALSVREGFNNPVHIDSTDPRDRLLVQRLKEKAMGEGQEEGPAGQGQKVQSLRPSDYQALSGAVLFDDNDAHLSAASLRTIDDIAQRLRGMMLVVEVHGHASAAEAYQQSDQAMQLSFNRALVVAKALAERGLEWRQLRVEASGDNDRIKPQAYAKAEQRQNQRAEIVVTNELLKNAP